MILKSLCAIGMALFALSSLAQPIEKTKITDGELGCRQIYDELGEMDKIISESKKAQSEAETTSTAGQAGGVAAEVASRTGLFGQVGGLFGHIAGTVMAKTAANVTEQSGKQSAQQGIEQEKQALARKEHLTSIFVAKGCKASNPDAKATRPNAVVAVAVSAPTRPALPPDEVVRKASANISPVAVTLDLDKNSLNVAAHPKVVVPGFRVAFVVKTKASAHSGGALANFGQHGSGNRTITQAQNKRVEMALAGADLNLLQSLTDRVYEDFMTKLRATNRQVFDIETLKKTPGYEKLKPVGTTPYTVSPSMQGDPRDYVVLAPKGLPLFFMHIDSYLGNTGAFDQNNTKAIHEICANLDAVAYIPTLQIDIAELESSGRSNFASSAEAEVTPKLGIGGRSELRYMNGKDVKIFYTGDFGHVIVKKPFYIGDNYGTIKTVDAFDTASLANSLTMATGLQGVQNFVEKRELRIDPLKFASGVLKVAATFSQGTLSSISSIAP